MKRIIGIFVWLLVYGLPLHAAEQAPWLLQGVKEYRLQNGLKLIVKEKHDAPLVAFSVWYNVGFMEDPVGKTHMSHYLEHMMFKGTDKYGMGQIPKLLAEAGSAANAFTMMTATVYFEVLPASRLQLAIDIESSRMRNCLFDPEQMRREKGVVESELRGRRDNPGSKLNRRLFEEAFGKNHPAMKFYGSLAGLKSITRAELKAFYDRYYVPANSFIVVVGAVRAEDVLRRVRKAFGAFPAGKAHTRRLDDKSPGKGGTSFTISGLSRDSFSSTIFYAPKVNPSSKEYWAARFISDSDLANVGYSQDFGIPVFFMQGSKQPRYPAEVMNEEYVRGVFAIKKQDYFNRQKFGYQKLTSVMFTIGHFEHRGSWREYGEQLAQYRKLTVEDVLPVIKRYLTRKNAVSGIFKIKQYSKAAKPRSSTGRMEDHTGKIDYSELENFTLVQLAREKQHTRELASRAHKLYKRFFSDMVRKRLANGVNLILLPQADARTVSVRVAVRAGYLYEQQVQQAALTASEVFDGGPFVTLKNRIRHAGGRVSGGQINSRFAFWSFSVPYPLQKVIPDMLGKALLGRSFMPIVHRAYQEKEVIWLEKFRKGQTRNPWQHAMQKYMELFFPADSRAGKRLRRKEADIVATAMEAVQRFYSRRYTGPNTTIVVTGRFDADKLLSQLQSILGSMPSGNETQIRLEKPLRPSRDRIARKVLEEKRESIVLLGTCFDRPNPRQRLQLELANSILGGGTLISRLGRNVRQKQGLSYGIGSVVQDAGRRMLWTIYAQTANKHVTRLIASARKEARRFTARGPTEMEVQKVLQRHLASLAFKMETPQEVSGVLLDYALRKRGMQDFFLLFELAGQTDASALRRTFADLVGLDALNIAVAGGK